jgi:hypothetical protein
MLEDHRWIRRDDDLATLTPLPRQPVPAFDA